MKNFPIATILGTSAALLAGCSGSVPPSASSLATTVAENRLHAPTNPQSVLRLLAPSPVEHRFPTGRSRMSPAAKDAALLYVSNTVASEVNVYSSSTFAPFGILLGFTRPYALCVDKAQDVYIPDLAAERVTEYAHGAIAPTRSITDHQGFPASCAVDISTGDLAIANFLGPSSSSGSVIVYRGAKGSPVKYAAPGLIDYYFVGYDNNGNLFVDGFSSSATFVLAELPKGKNAFKSITTNQSIGYPGDIVWDGEFLAVGDQLINTIYQFGVSGSKARVHGSTMLNGAADVFQFWPTGGNSRHPQAKAILGADIGAGAVGKWQYPAGGTPLKTITGLTDPEGVAISN